MRKDFEVNGVRLSINEWAPGRYTGRVGTYRSTGYTTSPGYHEAVLLAFLDNAGKAGAITPETANWPETEIRRIKRV